MTPLESEKKNLEMHVELQALRDEAVRAQLEDLQNKIETLIKSTDQLREMLDEVKEDLRTSIEEIKDERNNQLIKWGSAIIVTLVSALGLLFLRVILPLILGKPAGQ